MEMKIEGAAVENSPTSRDDLVFDAMQAGFHGGW
jgi:hypothetical protein